MMISLLVSIGFEGNDAISQEAKELASQISFKVSSFLSLLISGNYLGMD